MVNTVLNQITQMNDIVELFKNNKTDANLNKIEAKWLILKVSFAETIEHCRAIENNQTSLKNRISKLEKLLKDNNITIPND